MVGSLAIPILANYLPDILPNWIRILRGKSLQDTYTEKRQVSQSEQ